METIIFNLVCLIILIFIYAKIYIIYKKNKSILQKQNSILQEQNSILINEVKRLVKENSVFYPKPLQHIDLTQCKNANIIPDDKLDEYLSKIPDDFDEWLKSNQKEVDNLPEGFEIFIKNYKGDKY